MINYSIINKNMKDLLIPLFILILIFAITLLIPSKEYEIHVGENIGKIDTDLGAEIDAQLEILKWQREHN